MHRNFYICAICRSPAITDIFANGKWRIKNWKYCLIFNFQKMDRLSLPKLQISQKKILYYILCTVGSTSLRMQGKGSDPLKYVVLSWIKILTCSECKVSPSSLVSFWLKDLARRLDKAFDSGTESEAARSGKSLRSSSTSDSVISGRRSSKPLHAKYGFWHKIPFSQLFTIEGNCKKTRVFMWNSLLIVIPR